MQWLSRVPGFKLKGAFPPSFVYAKFTTLMTTTAAHLWLALDLIKAVGVVDIMQPRQGGKLAWDKILRAAPVHVYFTTTVDLTRRKDPSF